MTIFHFEILSRILFILDLTKYNIIKRKVCGIEKNKKY